MAIKEVYFENTELSKVEEISKRYGRNVVLKDAHDKWLYGKLSQSENPGTYLLIREDKKDEKRLHFRDLEQLLEINKSGQFFIS
jgi:hypothetical protein